MNKILVILGGLLLSGTSVGVEYGCAAGAQSLYLACGFDVQEGYLVGLANCGDTQDQQRSNDCIAEVEEFIDEDSEECEEVFEARMELCEKLNDQVHEVQFGEEYTDKFVDPLEIGATVDPNPWFPLVQGNVWVYEASGLDDEGEEVAETIIVTVTGAVKLIEGIPCLVVNDTVSEEGDVLEDTDDWFAQDINGNVWYCGEVSRNYEIFEGDEPEESELVDLEGSWKSGRDGAEAGMLLPFSPEIGQVIRTEVLFSDAEDVIEIESLEGSESSPVASCNGDCLVTLDYTPLEPGVFENKYYAAGVGMIVETKLDSDERVELIQFTSN